MLTTPKLIEVSLHRGPLDGLTVRACADLPFWVCPRMPDGTRSSVKYLYAPLRDKLDRFVLVSASPITSKDHDRIAWGPIQQDGKIIAYGGLPQ